MAEVERFQDIWPQINAPVSGEFDRRWEKTPASLDKPPVGKFNTVQAFIDYLTYGAPAHFIDARNYLRDNPKEALPTSFESQMASNASEAAAKRMQMAVKHRPIENYLPSRPPAVLSDYETSKDYNRDKLNWQLDNPKKQFAARALAAAPNIALGPIGGVLNSILQTTASTPMNRNLDPATAAAYSRAYSQEPNFHNFGIPYDPLTISGRARDISTTLIGAQLPQTIYALRYLLNAPVTEKGRLGMSQPNAPEPKD